MQKMRLKIVINGKITSGTYPTIEIAMEKAKTIKAKKIQILDENNITMFTLEKYYSKTEKKRVKAWQKK